MYYGGVLKSIRKYARNHNVNIVDNVSSETNCIMHTINSVPKGTKFFYDLLMKKTVVTHKYCDKWKDELNTDIEWKKVFENVSHNIEIKLRWFQIRINTRIICTNITLFAMKLKNNDLCTFCNEERHHVS